MPKDDRNAGSAASHRAYHQQPAAYTTRTFRREASVTDRRPIDLAVLRDFSPLDGFKRRNLAALTKEAERLSIPANRPLFREGTTDKRTYYLVFGEVELRKGTAVVDRIRGGTPEAKYPLGPGNPRRFSAYAATAVELIVFDSDLLDLQLTWDQTGIYNVRELTSGAPAESDDWMTTLLQNEVFHRIPPSNLQTMFMRLERVTFRADEVVVKRGDEGDFFYAITSGRCSVTREDPVNGGSNQLAELGPGDCFGDEALISDARRSATVTMLTDGVLMRLAKSEFNGLLNEPMLQRVSYLEAAEQVATGGATWLDVRLPSEFQFSHLPGAINLPLSDLRLSCRQLDPKVQYVAVCDTGRRSSVGAFMLNTRGYNTAMVAGGIPMLPSTVAH
jgi:CRP-like cAMP-binding protein